MRTLLLTLALFFFASTATAAEFPVQRPPLPGGTSKVGPNRYVTKATYNDVLEWYKRVFRRIGGIRWYTVINQPGVRAKHMRSLRKNSKWQGMNIGEYGGRVHLYILMRDDKS